LDALFLEKQHGVKSKGMRKRTIRETTSVYALTSEKIKTLKPLVYN